MNTVVVEQDGRTLTSILLFPSLAVRDTVLKSGLEGSAGEHSDGSPSAWRLWREATGMAGFSGAAAGFYR